MLSPQRGIATLLILLLFVVPALHPLLLPVVGVPSHLLWFAHVLPIAWITYHRGRSSAMAGIALSLLLLTLGERAFGNGYFQAASWGTVVALGVALAFTNVLVAGFADYARRAQFLQEQLWHSQKLETLGLFAASVAHDFSNMITAITLTTEIALADLAPDDPHREPLREIEQAAERAALLSKRLLAFGRREVVQAAPLDLAALIRDMEGMLRRLVSPQIELVVNTEAVPAVIADRGHVEQILLNLVVNASDAIPGRGTIRIAASRASLRDVPAHRGNGSVDGRRFVMIEVSDTGVGMDAAVVRRIFEPLFTTKPPGKGTGLGLSTVRALVDNWDGQVTVVSVPGQGTVFRVFLPAAANDAGSAASPVERELRLPLLS
jgi:two-component system, cell cycle sensor histidine kinase and response regulator CckA